MSSPYEEVPRKPPQSSCLLPLVLVFLVLAGLVVWRYFPQSGNDINSVPREITPRGDLAEDEKATIDLFRKISPSVVHITNLTEHGDMFSFNSQKVPIGAGSGFIWDDAGHVVTNYHVVQNASAVRVILADRSTYETRNIWAYPDKDLAVLKIKAPKGKLRPIPVGTSKDLQVGQKAFAIGNPFGLDQTLTTGVVSALGREIESVTRRQIQGVIQTNAAINPGNSGGPLLDSSGRLIGVTTAILSPSGTFAGIGFAIPVDEVNRIVPELVSRMDQSNDRQGMLIPPRIGVKLVDDQLADKVGIKEGALIFEVVRGSPAAKAGLRPTRTDARDHVKLGDVIVAIDDKPVRSSKDVAALLEQHKVGDTVKVTVERDGDRVDVSVTLEQ